MEKDVNAVKKYWDDQAEKYKTSSLATSPDIICFQMEIDKFVSHIFEGAKVLDIGCGNGYKGREITKKIKCYYYGIDYSEEMIKNAKACDTNLCIVPPTFKHGNILNQSDLKFEDFDIVMTDRCLINLTSLEEQIHAVKNIHSVLKPSGTYLMMENYINPLQNLNSARQTFQLPPIEVRWHNLYLDESIFLDKISNLFSVLEIDNFASTYYLVSRTLNALLNSSNGMADYNSDLNKYAAMLPPLGNFSPEKLIVMKKI